MSIWYELTPLDTLFFRGSEPMEAGQLTSEALFPPPVSVLQGALRTALLCQQKITFAEYKKGENIPASVLEAIGPCGAEAPFNIAGLLIKYQERIFAPAPSMWFVDLKRKPKTGADFDNTDILYSKQLETGNSLAMRVSAKTVPLVAARNEAISLAGYWVDLNLLSKPPKKLGPEDVLLASNLFQLEHRTGIAVDANRKVEQGRIYSSAHIRLCEDVRLIVSIDRDLCLEPEGLLRLGGEQRVCAYAKCKAPELPKGQTNLFMTLTPLALTAEKMDYVVCAAKPHVLAGWDLSVGFHKPTSTWLPAGAIVTKAFNASCIPFIM